jgi:hypothetical protein
MHQSMGGKPCMASSALVLLKCLQPKKPRDADRPLQPNSPGEDPIFHNRIVPKSSSSA